LKHNNECVGNVVSNEDGADWLLTLSQLLTDKVAARPQTRLLDSKQDKQIIILCQSQIKKQVVELGLETNQKKLVLDPKVQCVPVRIGDGGFWRWSPMNVTR
jgi:hypothetical protein